MKAKKRQQRTEFEYYKKTCYEPIKGFRFACRNKKEESYNRQQTDTLFKKRKMSALRFAESIMRLPCGNVHILEKNSLFLALADDRDVRMQNQI